nr:WbqC family protein [Chitinophagaceae bacterium]
MIAAIHQPNFIPWIGYFYKIAKSDIFILLDDVQYSKNSFINRNQIVTPQGANWVTLSVKQSGKFAQNINAVILADREKNVSTILKSIEGNYKKAPFFSEFFEIFKNDLLGSDNLSEINMAIIRSVCEFLSIETQLKISSKLNVTGQSTMRLIDICKTVNSNEYLSGFGGNNYQEVALFQEYNIKLSISDFQHPTYKQLWGKEFQPNMSILDFLFNCGREYCTHFFKGTN